MKRKLFVLAAVAVLGCQATGKARERRTRRARARFAAVPAAVAEGEGVKITFAAAAPTDCAVWILDEKGEKVRHLAAGMLGGDAPPPLAAKSLKQSLVWDGRDDRGRPVAKGKYTVKVGLGTQARFDRVIGQAQQWLGNIRGLAVGPRGKVYAYSGRGICVLDRDGKYLRQIAPAPLGFPVRKLPGLKPVKLADGTTYFQRGYAFPGNFVGSMAITRQGLLLLPGPARYARKLTKIGIDGSVPADAFDTRLTALSDIGFLHLAASPDGKTVYMAGAEAGYKGDDARKVVYRQVVYRLRLDSAGPAEVFTGDDENSGGPGFSVSKPKGLACDAKGNLYVCNHKGDNIAVYNPAGGLLKAFKIDGPQLVAVNSRTGQVYCLAGREKGYTKYGYNYPATMYEARLVRFGADGKVELSHTFDHAWVRNKKSRPGPCYRLTMAADFSGKRPVIWVGVAYPGASWSNWNLLRIEDEGKAFSKPKEITPKPTGKLGRGPLQMVLDRKRDLLYYNAGNKLARYTGEGKWLPSLKFTDPKSGKRFYLCEAGLDPDGNICALVYGQWKYRNARVVRFTPEGKWLPFAKAPQGVPVAHPMKGGGGGTTRGFTVAPNGDMYAMYYDDKYPGKAKLAPWDRAFGLRVAVAHISPQGEIKTPRLIAHLRAGGNCVRADRAGNVYVADNFMPLGVTFPRDFVGALPDPLRRIYPARLADGSFDPLLRNMGSVIKFGPAGGRVAGLPARTRARRARRPAGDLWKPVPQTQWVLHNNNKLKVTGAKWQYHGISPIPAQYQGVTHVERCVCRGGRFDLDEFGRVFLPDALRKRVTVLDGAGNVVLRFGRRGNLDSAGPEIAFSNPWWLAAASDRAYVGDASDWRIVKVRLAPSVAGTIEVERK